MKHIKFFSLLSSAIILSSVIVVSSSLASCGGDSGSDSGSGGGGTTSFTDFTPARDLAFPGADGGARNITGAAASTSSAVYVVSNLNDSGAGSFRDAVSKDNRYIVFAVSGQINLSNKINIAGNNLTIAGQTAPGDGITLAGYPVTITGSNVILRFLRFRMGDINDSKMSASEIDGADALSSSGKKDVLIDHCSISWSFDECASFYGMTNFTLQYCAIEESLHNSVHGKGSHGYGGIWGGSNATFHHNLLAHHDSRNPRFDHDYVCTTARGPIHFINNVVYNWGANSTYGGESVSPNQRQINMVNNYYKPGPATSSSVKTRLVNPTTKCGNCGSSVSPGLFYITGNYMYNSAGVTSDNWSGVYPDESSKKEQCKATAYQGTENSFVEKAEDAFESVLKYAGASLSRDAVDIRILGTAGSNGTGGEVRNGSYTYNGSNGSTGGLIDSHTDVGGYPALQSGTPYTDKDYDGMDDAWEEEQIKALGITGKTFRDFYPNKYNLTAKYTNLEVFLNSLVQNTFPEGAGSKNIK